MVRSLVLFGLVLLVGYSACLPVTSNSKKCGMKGTLPYPPSADRDVPSFGTPPFLLHLLVNATTTTDIDLNKAPQDRWGEGFFQYDSNRSFHFFSHWILHFQWISSIQLQIYASNNPFFDSCRTLHCRHPEYDQFCLQPSAKVHSHSAEAPPRQRCRQDSGRPSLSVWGWNSGNCQGYQHWNCRLDHLQSHL